MAFDDPVTGKQLVEEAGRRCLTVPGDIGEVSEADISHAIEHFVRGAGNLAQDGHGILLKNYTRTFVIARSRRRRGNLQLSVQR